MLVDKFNVERFGEVLPHMENILRCGLYSFSYKTKETCWSRGMYEILGVEPDSIESTFENFASYILPDDKERVTTLVISAREKEEAYTVDFSLLDARGIYKRI